jgi:hypothetical protein
MDSTELLEITMTHNLDDEAEVNEVYRRKWIALDWGRKGSDPSVYSGRAKTDVTLFNTVQQKGAAVIAAYKKATQKLPSHRLIGLVAAGVEFEDLNGLLCLPLSAVQELDSSRSFLGNLAPRQCTIQPCGNRSRGRLADLVLGKASPYSVGLLHHLDVEWLVTNYLFVTGICKCVWSGGRSYEDIDHAGWMSDGRELLAQTTISANLVKLKAERLLRYSSPNRVLYMFGPETAADACLDGITFETIEGLVPRLLQEEGGQWLLSRMLPSSVEPQQSSTA